MCIVSRDNVFVSISTVTYIMADVKTESLKAVDNNTSTIPVKTEKMTVEKQLGQPPVSKNKNTVKEGTEEAHSGTQAQLKVASGNSAPASPKKSDPKNSPTSKVPSGSVPPKTQQQQQQQLGKLKVNPWHKNSATPASGSVVKKGAGLATEGNEKDADNSESSSPKEDTSKSIKIPRDEVCCMYIGVVCI